MIILRDVMIWLHFSILQENDDKIEFTGGVFLKCVYSFKNKWMRQNS